MRTLLNIGRVRSVTFIKKVRPITNKVSEFSIDARLPKASLDIGLEERARRAKVELDALDEAECPQELLEQDFSKIIERNEEHLTRKKKIVREEVVGLKLVLKSYPVYPATCGLNNVVLNYLPMVSYQNAHLKFSCVVDGNSAKDHFVVEKFDGEEETVPVKGEMSAAKIIEKLEQAML